MVEDLNILMTSLYLLYGGILSSRLLKKFWSERLRVSKTILRKYSLIVIGSGKTKWLMDSGAVETYLKLLASQSFCLETDITIFWTSRILNESFSVVVSESFTRMTKKGMVSYLDMGGIFVHLIKKLVKYCISRLLYCKQLL